MVVVVPRQVAAVVAAAYSFIMSYLIFRFIGLFLELHVEADAKQVRHLSRMATWSEGGS